MAFQKIEIHELKINPFTKIGEEWMLITAGKPDNCNTMTASWGGVGIIWGKPSVTAYIRPERYTYEFINREEFFTLSFFGEKYRDKLAFCGSKSGRDVDKIKACGFTIGEGEAGGVYIQEADMVFVCRKRYRHAMKPEDMCFDPSPFYGAKGNYHDLFIGEITEILVRE